MTIDANSTNNTEQSMVQCPNCRAIFDAKLNFCGRCGLQLNEGTPITSAASALEPVIVPPRSRWLPRWYLSPSIIVALLALIIASSVLFALLTGAGTRHSSAPAAIDTSNAATTPEVEGRAWFYQRNNHIEGVALSLHHLPSPPAGKVYSSWLVNPRRPHQWLLIGTLQPDKHGNVSFRTGKDFFSSHKKQNLQAVFAQVLVTLEESHASPLHPSEQVVLRGTIDKHIPANN